MKVRYILLPLLLLGTSCSREAESIKAKKSLLTPPAVESLEIASDDIDQKVRSITLISYPNPEELNGVDFRLSEKEFDDVFYAKKYDVELTSNNANSLEESFLVPYGDIMPNGITKGDDNLDKASDVIMQIINVGNVRDEAFREYVSLKRQLEPSLGKIESVNNEISTYSFYEITNKKDEFEDYRRQLVLERFKKYGLKTKSKPKDAKNCNNFDRRYEKLALDLEFKVRDSETGEVIETIPAFTDTELEKLNSIKEDCRLNDQITAMQDGFMGKQLLNSSGKIELESTYNAGKTYVTNLLDRITLKNNKTYLSTGVYKESDLDGSAGESFKKRVALLKDSKGRLSQKELLHYSEIDLALTEDKKFKKFKLHLELLGSNPRVYSLENGGITNFSYDTYLGAKRLMFTINGKDRRGNNVVVNAELGQKSSSTMGVRFVGDAEFIYDNGTRNDGVMKIELDIKDDQIMPVELDEDFFIWCDEAVEQEHLQACQNS